MSKENKFLRELAQWHEKEAKNLRLHSTSPSMPELADMHEETAIAIEEAADEIEMLRAAIQDLAKHIWRGDWDKLDPNTQALVGEKG